MMKKISSGNTRFMKNIFPVLWFGILALVIAGAIFGKAPLPVLLGPLFMAALGFVLMKGMIWDLADEVYDCGDSLLVENGGQQDRVPLSNIMNVSATTLTNPPRITLRLIVPGAFGDEIVFSPVKRIRLNPFAKNEIAEDLILRVHRARSARL
jgi:hypothetical protein